jgi:trinucleotide repeat-containing gene 6 protein
MGGGWNEDKNMSSWGEPPMQQNNSWAKPKTPTNPSAGGWVDDGMVDTSSWGAQPKTSKEEIEMALRSSNNMNLDAIDSLDALGGNSGGIGMGGVGQVRPPLDRMDQSSWPMQQQRRGQPPPPEDHFDIGIGVGPGPMGMGPPPQQRGGFPGNPAPFPGGANSLMNNVANPSLASINPTLLQKILTQQPNPPQAFNTGRVQPNNTTSPRQLSLLVQQIQMAVQAGYLSSQILQHPLPQQSLYLLNQLLQNIKIFQQLTQAQQQIGKTNSTAALQLSVQITKTKQQITNLHNQIAAQQALHAKQQQQQQQQQQQHHHLAVAAAAAAAAANQPNNPNNDFFKPPMIGGSGGGGSGGGGGGSGMMDPMMSALQGNFGSDYGLKDGGQHQQSRLTQWTKLPSLEKDDANTGSEFSRAPGPQSNNPSQPPLLKNSSLGLGQSDNTWSSIVPRSGSDGWPTGHATASVPTSNNSNMNLNDDNGKPNPGVNMNADAWPSDLVPEFEPGKPWKGNQILKTVEDDPTLTPGSVVRSPLSMATIKDTSEIFVKNSSPPSVVSSIASDQLSTPLSLNSDTWSFTPTSSGAANMSNPMGKLNPGKGVWDDMSQRNLWDYSGGGGGGVGSIPGSRPPPGLPKKVPGQSTPSVTASGNSAGSNSNSFNSYRNNIWGSNQPSGGGNGGGNNAHYWLLLKNLTPQIDGSTLKTLCIQHGPLLNFQLYQSHGVALVRYTSREEAAKAQNALNNCVLGNTTILAETAGEQDVHNLTQGSGNAGGPANNSQPPPHSTSGGFSSGGSNGRSTNENPWGVLRDSSPLWSSSPWGSTGLDGPDRATPSSLNSLLPGDLLGGESA